VEHVVFEPYRQPLLFLHLAAAVSTLAVAVHLLVRLAQSARKPNPWLARSVRRHAWLLFSLYAATWVLGALIYPAFRILVRYAYLDETLPWATGLFEIKEHAATLGLVPALGVLLLARGASTTAPPLTRHAVTLGALTGGVAAVLLFNAWCGWYLGTLRPL
jgi:hypothetical protein